MNKDYIDFFYEISKISRQSGKEEQIRDYLISFAIERNLKYYTDEYYNVVIWKNASINCKNNEYIGLQAHVDMVCEKKLGNKHDFSKDPLQLIEQDGFIKAKDTTLGADNGVGVAYILSILDSDKILHPKIEAIFTTQEETTMNGVKNIDGEILKSKKIISFDNFCENEIWIGSASSQEWYTELSYTVQQIENVETYELYLYNFLGGHAGMDIGDKKRQNPIKVASKILEKQGVFINEINGGNLINVIPTECKIIFSVKNNQKELIIKNIITRIMDEKKNFPQSTIQLNKIKDNFISMDINTSNKILELIKKIRIGAIYRDSNKNVIVGCNLAKVFSDDSKIYINFCVRGNKRHLTDKFVYEIDKIIKKYRLYICNYDEWKGFEQRENNELIKLCKYIYRKERNDEPNILGVQACLECEYLSQKIDGFQYVALGTNIYNAHSIEEKVELKSIIRTWYILEKILLYYYRKEAE